MNSKKDLPHFAQKDESERIPKSSIYRHKNLINPNLPWSSFTSSKPSKKPLTKLKHCSLLPAHFVFIEISATKEAAHNLNKFCENEE